MNFSGSQAADSPAPPRAEIDPQLVRAALQDGKSDVGLPAAAEPLFRLSQRTSQITGFGISGIGTSVPDRIVTNEELESQFGFERGWIERRTGIRERRLAPLDEGTSDLAVRAAKAALADANLSTSDVDLLIVSTFTPDYTCPSTAGIVQDQLNLDAPAMDLQAACSGFMYGLATAGQFIATGNSRCALVVGADLCSRICRPDDMRTAPLFGDGAGAVVLEPGDTDQGLIRYQLGADGRGARLLCCPVGGSRVPATSAAIDAGDHFLTMEGRNVFKWAIQVVTETVDLILKKADVSVDDVSLFVLHQANIRIIDHAVKVLGIPPEKVLNNVDRVGNTSAASIPLVLAEANDRQQLQRGDLILMCGFGAGLTWGTGLYRW